MTDKTKKVKVTIETAPEYLDKIMNAINSVKSNSVIRIIGETLKPMIPMLESALALIDEITQIFEKAQCNKNICRILKDRIIAAEAVIKLLQQRIEKGEKLDKVYQQTFLRFKNSLENIKNYTEEVSQIQGIKRYLNVHEIKDKFIQLTSEYDTCIKDLNFTMNVSYEEQRRIDQKCLETDINLMKEFLEKIQTIFDENFKLLSQEVNVRNPELKGYKYNPGIKVHEIDPAMIKNPALGSESDSRGKLKKVVKRIIKDGVEIACKKIDIPTEIAASEEYQMSLRYLPILEKLGHDQFSTDIGNKYLDLLNWMAPEKMQKYKIIVSGKSPKTDAELFPYTQKYSENDLIQKNLIVIIEKAWEHNPDVRTSLEQLYIDVSNLSKKVIPGKDPALLTINKLDGSHEDSTNEESEFNDLYITDYSGFEFEQIPLVEEGIKLHNTKNKENRKKAWECFKANAESNNVAAIYWKGYYLQEGHYTDENRTEEQKKRDKEEAMKLYKIAADRNHHDAQLRYAHSLPRVKEYRDEFLKYLTLAADNGNAVAMYTLADMYLYGKVIDKDLEKGERYLKLSAACKNDRALAMAQKL
ncbi:6369_t:CDS:2, partial [Racocetra persica]